MLCVRWFDLARSSDEARSDAEATRKELQRGVHEARRERTLYGRDRSRSLMRTVLDLIGQAEPRSGVRPDGQPGVLRQTPPDGEASSSQARWSRHHEALVAAEIRQLAAIAGTLGPLPRATLARLAHSQHWREGCFDAAVHEALRRGDLRSLPFDFLAIPVPPAREPDPAHPSVQRTDRPTKSEAANDSRTPR